MRIKLFIFTAVFTALSLLVYANEKSFINALETCSPYSDSGTINSGQINATSTKKIIGWEGDKCVYNEKVSFMGINSDISCKLNKSQINELTSVMKAYELMQKYSDSSSDFSDIESAQNTPVGKVWNKFLQDSSVCTMTTDAQAMQSF